MMEEVSRRGGMFFGDLGEARKGKRVRMAR